MNKKLCLLSLCFLLACRNAYAVWFSFPPETKVLTENLTTCRPFEYQRKNVFDINLKIKGQENESCALTCDLTELENEKKSYHFSCLLSDFNIEELKLAFEEATVNVIGLIKNKNDDVILELFEGFTQNNICQQTK